MATPKRDDETPDRPGTTRRPGSAPPTTDRPGQPSGPQPGQNEPPPGNPPRTA